MLLLSDILDFLDEGDGGAGGPIKPHFQPAYKITRITKSTPKTTPLQLVLLLFFQNTLVYTPPGRYLGGSTRHCSKTP